MENRKIQVVDKEPHAKVRHRDLAARRLLRAEAVLHSLLALMPHGVLHYIPSADVAACLSQRAHGQQPRYHRCGVSRRRTIGLGWRRLARGIQQCMTSLAQKYRELPLASSMQRR
jgi:hypothetical protein